MENILLNIACEDISVLSDGEYSKVLRGQKRLPLAVMNGTQVVWEPYLRHFFVVKPPSWHTSDSVFLVFSIEVQIYALIMGFISEASCRKALTTDIYYHFSRLSRFLFLFSL